MAEGAITTRRNHVIETNINMVNSKVRFNIIAEGNFTMEVQQDQHKHGKPTMEVQEDQHKHGKFQSPFQHNSGR